MIGSCHPPLAAAYIHCDSIRIRVNASLAVDPPNLEVVFGHHWRRAGEPDEQSNGELINALLTD